MDKRQVHGVINPDTRRICSYCGLGYTDGEGTHPYEVCEKRLRDKIDTLIDQLVLAQRRLRGVQGLVNEGGQRK